MGHPGLDPETSLQLIQTLLYCLACILGGSVLLGLAAYIAFLWLQIFSPQPGSKTRIAHIPQPVGCAPAAEENLDRFAAETQNLIGEEPFGGETVQAPALSDSAQIPMTPPPVTTGSETARRWGSLSAFL